MKNGLEGTSQIVDIWENAELMTKKIQVAKTKVRNRVPKMDDTKGRLNSE